MEKNLEMVDLEQKEEEFYKIQKILCERADSGIGVNIDIEGLNQEDVYAKLLDLQNKIKRAILND